MKNSFLKIICLFLMGICQNVYSQEDYRDKFLGTYECDVEVYANGNHYWTVAKLPITKSDTNSQQLMTWMNKKYPSIVNIDTSGYFGIPIAPSLEWGQFYLENDSLYYYMNGVSPLGYVEQYYCKKQIINSTIQSELKSEIEIYPNPTKDKIVLKKLPNVSQFSIEITNEIGQKIFTKEFLNATEELEIIVKDYPKGIYFIHLLSTEKTYSLKFEKE